jgi:hypothetical protein
MTNETIPLSGLLDRGISDEGLLRQSRRSSSACCTAAQAAPGRLVRLTMDEECRAGARRRDSGGQPRPGKIPRGLSPRVGRYLALRYVARSLGPDSAFHSCLLEKLRRLRLQAWRASARFARALPDFKTDAIRSPIADRVARGDTRRCPDVRDAVERPRNLDAVVCPLPRARWLGQGVAADGDGEAWTSPTAVSQPRTDADWTAAIRYGGPAVGLSSQMPAFGEVLDNDHVAGLVAHMRRFCAERSWPSGNLNFPRPIFTEKAFPETEVVLMPVASHNTRHPDSASLSTTYERRLGPRAQMEVVLPVESVYVADRQNGVGDVEVGVKYALNPRASGNRQCRLTSWRLQAGSRGWSAAIIRSSSRRRRRNRGRQLRAGG